MNYLITYALVCCFLMLVGLSAVAASPEKPFFPLMAWDYVDDEDTLQKMADCSINSVAFIPTDILDACHKFGIQAIVYDEAVSGSRWDQPFDADKAIAALPELIAKVNDHPAVWGYHLKDEPSPHEFEALDRAAQVVRELAPDKWPYINLLPGDGPNYDTYLEQFIQICKPPIVSYDRYVLLESGSHWPTFWTNIAQVRDAAIRHNLPFHNIVLTSSHWSYREVTAEDIRMQVFGSLVYGARGIGYYKFMSQELDILEAPDLGNFRMGPLDEFGEKTQVWEYLRNTNRMVSNLAPFLTKLSSDDVYHFGEVPERNQGPSDQSLVKGFHYGDGFVVGDFTHEDGSRWVMIVNKIPGRSILCRPDFREPVTSVQYVSPRTGQLRPYPDPYYALAPGQGVLLKLGM